MTKSNDHIVIFKTEDDKISVDVRFDEDTVWLTLDQMAELFERDKSTISRHIKNVFDEGELERDSVVANFATTASDGKTYKVDYYNLDVIISVGYRVKSLRGMQFRKWATKRLNEYILKGFTMDDERLKTGGGRYFRELLQRIRDIRSSERNLYQQVTDIYATSVDYDPKAATTRDFFASVQNKLHYAAHKHTAAELIHERVNSNKLHVGMTNFKGEYATKSDVVIDIAVAINDFAELEPLIPVLELNGFLHRGWYIIGRLKVLNVYEESISGGGDRVCTHHIHIVITNSKEWNDHIIFRDYMNKNASVAKKYEALKMELAMANTYDEEREKYRAGKHDFIEQTLKDALAWSLIHDIHGYDSFIKIEPLNKGWSADKKYEI
ncbi:MAG: virulence RhuM family protein [Oscillospiraceae bacterium]|nr:virulence RhuM family protein [Oscillospiraceae bacterium]